MLYIPAVIYPIYHFFQFGFSIFGDTLLKSEGQLLWWYFQNHCEYPPINYTQTTVRNDIVKIL